MTMKPGNDIIAINWGSSAFRAQRIGPDGELVDQFAAPKGISGLGRDGMVAMMDIVAERWPGVAPVYASGMIGSNAGWVEAPYCVCPANAASLASSGTDTLIGNICVHIVPGLTCQRPDGEPDILRGEEIEIFGCLQLLAADGQEPGFVVLPGTHAKWARVEGGTVRDFFTSMSGEIFDRMTANGLLASIIDGEAEPGPVFGAAVHLASHSGLGLGSLLFNGRARVIRGLLRREDAGSHIRGLLIGAEIADALRLYPALKGMRVPLVGNPALCRLYADALVQFGIEATFVDSASACLAGFSSLHQSRTALAV